MIRLVIAGLAGVLTLAAGAAEPTPVSASPAGRPLSERTVLIVGASTDNYPYGFLDSKGNWTGFSSDLLNAVARTMKLRIQRVEMPGEELRDRFRKGEFDLLQALSESPERGKYADFSVPYLILEGAIFVQKKDSSIKKLEDLNGKKFAWTGRDTISTRFLLNHQIKVEDYFVPSVEAGLRAVDAGECSGVYISKLTALSVIERAGLKNVVVLNHPITDYDIRHCFAVHKGDAQLLARLNEGLAILHQNGEFDRIYHSWFGRFTSPTISRTEIANYAMGSLVVALTLALFALHRQRVLHSRIARQATELTGQKSLLQTLYDNIPMAMCVIDLEANGYRILSINHQAEGYFGLSSGHVAGCLLTELPHGSEWITLLSELLREGLSSHAVLRQERRLVSANKRLLFTLVPMSTEVAGVDRFCVLAEDITERRNLDDEIAQSRKLRAVGELVGGIAHEFNNLITPIILQVGQIKHDWAHDSNLLSEIKVIAEAVQRSSELTRRLLTFGRKADQGAELVELSSVVSNCFALLKLTMDRRVTWEQAVPAELPPIYFSVTDLNQIILNLVINARDTLLEKLSTQRENWTPTIRIEAQFIPEMRVERIDAKPSTRQILGWQRLTIRDNGMGMPPEVRERIFEPFFTTKEVGKGTGLGLATVWHLVTAVSGRIEVESTPGEGTAFHIYLPMVPAPESIVEPVKKAPAVQTARRIFLAEDDALVAGTVISALKRANHAVTHLPDGASAWLHLQVRANDYDLLLLDINMPGMDGIELAQRVRASCQYRGRLIIASGRLSSDDMQQLATIKVDKILSKPFTIEELLDATSDSPKRNPQESHSSSAGGRFARHNHS